MLHQFADKQQASEAVARLFIETAKEAVAQNGRFTVALTGGSSPELLYTLLANPPLSQEVPWQHCFIFWGDERWVPLTDEKSNAKMSFEKLLNHVPVPKTQVFPMWADGQSSEAFAKQYEDLLLDIFDGVPPRFDLILLGMGEDGHTASLFPGTKVLQEQNRWVEAYYLDAQQMFRITFTAPLINQAKKIAVLAFGGNKAKALQQVWEGTHNPELFPAQLIKKDPEAVQWFVDTSAASLLQQKTH